MAPLYKQTKPKMEADSPKKETSSPPKGSLKTHNSNTDTNGTIGRNETDTQQEEGRQIGKSSEDLSSLVKKKNFLEEARKTLSAGSLVRAPSSSGLLRIQTQNTAASVPFPPISSSSTSTDKQKASLLTPPNGESEHQEEEKGEGETLSPLLASSGRLGSGDNLYYLVLSITIRHTIIFTILCYPIP